MRTVFYTCETCKGKFDKDEKLLRIGDYDSDTLIVRNNLPNRRIISIDNHDPIHFCSKKCFIEYFFSDETTEQILP